MLEVIEIIIKDSIKNITNCPEELQNQMGVYAY